MDDTIAAMSGEERDLVTAHEAAEILDIPYLTLYRRARENAIPHVWQPRNKLDRRPRLMFELSKLRPALDEFQRQQAAKRPARRAAGDGEGR